MDEKRKFFRIKNNGEIQARFDNQVLEVIDVSASSAAVLTDLELPQTGIIELKINLFVTKLDYEILRKRENNSTILIFNNESQIEKLLVVLKNLRKEQNKS
ncbi:PilZ domain-containing protein [Legionella sp. km772]|uniref:PilZ domain-containing protein n=1 Tax=Legionella sp. km772 TaxID=2498111 RepID=UPI000F8CB80B|nr:PilZ domain-containing protein [Legionella sp. km772]RUR12271.1 PilZ domain-containing protein [Legionella sp. km772]